MDFITQIISAVCGLLCCLGFWAVVIGGVVWYLRRNKGEAAAADAPGELERKPSAPGEVTAGKKPSAHDEDEIATVVAPQPPVSAPPKPADAPPPPPPSSAPPPPPRTSGATIIAFDDDEDDD